MPPEYRLPHRPYISLEEARSHPDAVLIMQADFGGQILLTCPLRHVRAGVGPLVRLLADLECVSWGRGFDPDDAGAPSPDETDLDIDFLPAGTGVVGGMEGGVAGDGLWLHPEIERELLLRPQIEAILRAERPRLDLPPGFPNDECATLEEAKRYPYARVVLFSGVINRAYVNAPAGMVRATRPVLLQLLHDLMARDAARPTFVPQARQGVTRVYCPRSQPLAVGHGPEPGLCFLGGPVTTPAEEAIRAVILGEREHI